MNIEIFGYKLNLEVLILIGVVYLILVGHLFCGCCNIHGLMEGMATQTDPSGNNIKAQVANALAAATPSVSTTAKEGFTGANINYGMSAPYSLSHDNAINTANWMQPNLTVTPGQPLSEGVKKFLAREPQPVPLPEGEMLLFANTKFAPEYCPNTYSNSSGCAAMTGSQYNYLITRGGNNVPYSEY